MKEQNGNEYIWKDIREDKGNMNVFLTVKFLFSLLQDLLRPV